MDVKKINWWRTKFNNNEVINVSKAIKNKNISQGYLTKNFEEKLIFYCQKIYIVAFLL